MAFNSVFYLIFFPVVVMLYFGVKDKFRWIILLAASYAFYMYFNIGYVIYLLVTTFISYSSALLMHKSKLKMQRRFYLVVALSCIIGVLNAMMTHRPQRERLFNQD